MSDPLSPERADALAKMSPDEIEAELRGLIARGADAVPLLLELEARAPDREWRKRVRRALHQLKSRGVAIERPEASGEGSVLRPVALREEQGVVAPIDPIGRRVVLLLQPGKGGARLYEIGISDEQGVLGLVEREGRQRDMRRFLRGLRRQGRAPIVFVPGPEVRALVARAAATGELPDEVDASKVEQISAGAGPCTPGERLREKLGSPDGWPTAAEVDARVAERIEAGRLLAWPLLGERIDGLEQQIHQIEHSLLVLSDAQKRERRSEALAAAAPAILDAAVRERLASRLEETAVFLEEEGDSEGAVALIALASRVRAAEQALAVDFLRRALELSLELARRRRHESESDKLMVRG